MALWQTLTRSCRLFRFYSKIFLAETQTFHISEIPIIVLCLARDDPFPLPFPYLFPSPIGQCYFSYLFPEQLSGATYETIIQLLDFDL